MKRMKKLSDINIKGMVGSILLSLTAAACCNNSYPDMFLEDFRADRPEANYSQDKVPVLISMDNPDYTIISRGGGAFDKFEEDRDHWIGTELEVYAYLSANHDYVGAPDYRVTEENPETGAVPYCLINGRKAVITDGPGLTWKIEGAETAGEDTEDNVPYYNSMYPDHRFNFFAYYADDAILINEQRDFDRIVRTIEIDGTQDVIVAYAFPTTEQIENLETGEDFKYLATNWNNLVYSTRTGKYNIMPVFSLEHAFLKMQFHVQGVHKDAEKVVIDAIRVFAPRRCDVMLAQDFAPGGTPALGVVSVDDTVIEDGPAADDNAGTVNVPDCSSLFVPPVERPDAPYGSTNRWADNQMGLNVLLDETQPAGVPILLPPTESYGVWVYYHLQEMPENIRTLRYNKIEIANGFEAGRTYDINLNIQADQQVEIAVNDSTLGWIDGGDISVGEDDWVAGGRSVRAIGQQLRNTTK